MTDAHMDERQRGTALLAVSNALVKLHKEQFGRGPTHARSDFAGPDGLVCTLEDAMLPAERTMVEMGEQQRVRESRTFLQVATANQFIATVEELLHRKVRAFASAIDPDAGIVWEVFTFESMERRADGNYADPRLWRSRPGASVAGSGSLSPGAAGLDEALDE